MKDKNKNHYVKRKGARHRNSNANDLTHMWNIKYLVSKFESRIIVTKTEENRGEIRKKEMIKVFLVSVP